MLKRIATEKEKEKLDALSHRKTRCYVCDCDCGQKDLIFPTEYFHRKNSPATSCGCGRREKLRQLRLIEYDLTRRSFVDLKVTRLAKEDEVPSNAGKTSGRWYVVNCKCGRGESIVSGNALTRGGRTRCDLCVRDAMAKMARERFLRNGGIRRHPRNGPASAKHARWAKWKSEGFSYTEITIKEKDETGEEVVGTPVIQRLKRFVKRRLNARLDR